MKRFKQKINERVSQVLYHGTEIQRASSIVKDDQFLLSEVWSQKEVDLNKGKQFFLSMARSINSAYIIDLLDDASTVVFALSGERLSQNFDISPVNYIGGRGNTNEYEDRLISSKQSIQASRYIIEIYAIFNRQYTIPEYEENLFYEYAQNIAPTYIFSNTQDFLNAPRMKHKADKL